MRNQISPVQAPNRQNHRRSARDETGCWPTRAIQPLLAALLVSSLATGCKGKDPSAAAGAPPPTPVKIQSVQSDRVDDSSEFVGTLEAQSRVTLQPQTQGRIDGVFVASGDRVEEGAPIFSLSLDQTEAQVNRAEAATNSARANLGNSEAQVDVAEADRIKAASDVDLKQADYNRTEQLVNQGAQARRQLDVARNDLNASIASLRAAEKRVAAARATVGQSAAGVNEAQADVASARVGLDQKQVLSPINGVIGDFSLKVGDYVSIGQTVTTVIQNDALDMRIAVPSNNAAKLKSGLPVDLIDPNTNTKLATGSVNFISPQVDTGAQSVLVKARFPNRDRKLRDGQYARAKILWNRTQGILVPTIAITRIGGQSFVFVVEQDSSQGEPRQVVHQKPVKLGNVQGDSYQVMEGVKAGDRIAVSNILKLREGAPVQPEA